MVGEGGRMLCTSVVNNDLFKLTASHSGDKPVRLCALPLSLNSSAALEGLPV